MATANKKVQKSGQVSEGTSAKKGAFSVSNAVRLDPSTPIPMEYNGSWYTTRKGGRYIPFLNPLDNFPQTLLEARLLSITANACVTTKADYCIGEGWRLNDGAIDKNLNDWASCVNKTGENLNAFLRSVFEYFFTFGNTFVKVTRVKVGTTNYLKVCALNNQDVRLMMPKDGDEFSSSVAVTKDFRRQGFVSLRANSFMELPLYTADKVYRKWAPDGDDESLVIHIKNKVAGYDDYGMPSNVSGLPSQLVEYKATRFNLDEFDNNMVVGGFLFLGADLSQTEADAVGKQIMQQHTGDGKRGRVIVMAGREASEGGSYQPMERSKEGSFTQSDKHTQEKIITANQWDALLAGVPRDTSLGNGGKGFLENIFEIKNKTVIVPMQQKIIEEVLKPIIALLDETTGTKYSKYGFGIIAKAPVSFAAAIDVNAVTTVDEGRALLGMGPAEDPELGKKMIATPQNLLNAKQTLTNVPT